MALALTVTLMRRFRSAERSRATIVVAIFVVLACFYKGQTYLQSQLTQDEIATEPILGGGAPT